MAGPSSAFFGRAIDQQFAVATPMWHDVTVSLLDVTTEIQAALTSLRRGQAFIADEIARLESFLAAASTTARPAAKRRGRPPKAVVQAGAAPAPITRGPGRPRKNPAADGPAAVVKRGPGRPRKNPVVPVKSNATTKRTWTPAQREEARKRMQEYWAKRKKKG